MVTFSGAYPAILRSPLRNAQSRYLSQVEAGGGGMERAFRLIRLSQEVGPRRDGEAETGIGWC